MKKRVFYAEVAYVFGIVLVALAASMFDKADFGMSMIVAPAYLLYRKLSLVWDFFTFGMAEYCVQALLIAALAVVMRRFRVSYLLSFATAVVYGLVLDGFMALLAHVSADLLWQRLLLYAAALLLAAAGVSLMFHTYLSPEAYELFVKEISDGFGLNINKFKTIYDCTSCAVGLLLSFIFFGFGKFIGVSWGTVVCALLNGWLIGRFSVFFERHWEFRDALPWRPFFTGRPAEAEESSAVSEAADDTTGTEDE